MERNDHLTWYSEPNRMEVGERIAFYRKEKGFTRKELSSLLNFFDEQNLTNWENGKKFPSLENLLNLCHALGVTADKLVKGEF